MVEHKEEGIMKNNAPIINWKLVIILSFLLLILLGGYYFISLYTHLQYTKITDKDETVSTVFQQTEVTIIEEIYEFHDEVSYHIVIGTTKEGERQYVFVPFKNDENEHDIIVYAAEQFVSVEKVEKDWQNSCEGCELKKSTPAMINGQPLWELAYEDQLNRYVITYIALLDGSVYEQVKLTRKYSKG